MHIDLQPELTMPLGQGLTTPEDVHTAAQAMFRSALFAAEFGSPAPVTQKDVDLARDVMTQLEPVTKVQTSPSAIYLRALIAQYDHEVVKNATQLRLYVTNSLIEEARPGAKNRVRALELLGKVTEVGLFTERTEVTVRHQSAVELEQSVREKLARLMGRKEEVQDVTVNDPPAEAPTDPEHDLPKIIAALKAGKNAQ